MKSNVKWWCKISDSILQAYQNLLSQMFDVIQSNIELHLQVHYSSINNVHLNNSYYIFSYK